MRKIELIMRDLQENIGKMSNSYFLSNIFPVAVVKVMNKISQQSPFYIK